MLTPQGFWHMSRDSRFLECHATLPPPGGARREGTRAFLAKWKIKLNKNLKIDWIKKNIYILNKYTDKVWVINRGFCL